jgi:microcystin-dependent protein
MGIPYVGEIRIFAGNFEPVGWQFCDGRLLPISENETLYNLIGTAYGGDGQSTFALPNLSQRVPVHQGTGGGASYTIGEMAGVESVTLTTNQIPVHNHAFLCSTNSGSAASPDGGVPGSGTAITIFRPTPPASAMSVQSVGTEGGNQPHENMQPYLCMYYIISLFGYFPSPS